MESNPQSEPILSYHSRRKKKDDPSPTATEKSKFTAKMLNDTLRDVKAGKIRVPAANPWVRITDDVQTGLRAIIRKSGQISFHASYAVGDSRPLLGIGTFPETSIETARRRTQIIRALADRGIDVQEGLHSRLLEEIDAMGMSWRPTLQLTVEDILDKVFSVLDEHDIKVPAAVRTHVRSEFK